MSKVATVVASFICDFWRRLLRSRSTRSGTSRGVCCRNRSEGCPSARISITSKSAVASGVVLICMPSLEYLECRGATSAIKLPGQRLCLGSRGAVRCFVFFTVMFCFFLPFSPLVLAAAALTRAGSVVLCFFSSRFKGGGFVRVTAFECAFGVFFTCCGSIVF